MKKLGWYAGSAALIGMIGGGVLLLAANLYVQSKGVQQQIRRALTSTLQMPARLTKTTLTPWEGLRIDGITVQPETAPGQGASPDVLKADSFRVRFAIRPLLERRFVVKEVLLDHPQLAWAQDARGRWRFPPEKAAPAPPAAAPEPTAPPLRAETTETVPPPAAAASAAVEAPLPAPLKTVEPKPDRFSVQVNRIRVRHGTFEFLNQSGLPVGRFEDVNLDGQVHGPRSATGSMWFGQATLPKVGLAATRFESRFKYDDAAGFTLQDGQAELGGGRVYLNYSVRTGEPGAPFEARCNLENVALDRLAPSLGGLLQGRLQGVLTASGLAGDSSSRRGLGRFGLIDGKLKDFPMLKTVGDSLRIEDLSHLEFKTAQLECRLDGEQVRIDSMQLVSNNLRLTAQGGYDGATDKINLQVRLIIDAAIGRQLPQFIEGNFIACGEEAPGCRYVDFAVGGALSKPTTDILERVLSGPMGSLFQNILAPKPKNPNKKPRKAPSPPAETPAASPPA